MDNKRELCSAAVRIRVMKRDRFRCTYCGVPGTDAELEIDHIIPVSKGGSNHMSNLTTSCRKCNQSKGNKKIMPKEINHTPDSIIGMWAVVPSDDSEWAMTGFVRSKINDDLYLIQAISALTGEPNVLRIVPLKDMITWRYFDDATQLNYVHERYWEDNPDRGNRSLCFDFNISDGKFVSKNKGEK